MPTSVNGFGTANCGSRGDVGWGSEDSVECIVAAGMPLVPIKCVHTFDWNGDQYRAIPIRWSLDLLMRAYVGQWLWALGIGGLICGVIAFVSKAGFNPLLFALAVALVLVAIGLRVLLLMTGQRAKKIRLVLGGVGIGHCDPANFTRDLLDQLAGNPRAAYDTDTFAEASEQLLDKGSYAQAMWAARLCLRVENAARGEALTDRILNDPDVNRAVAEVKRDGRRWAELMLTEAERAPAAEAVEDDEPDPCRPRDEGRPAQRRNERTRRARDEDEDY